MFLAAGQIEGVKVYLQGGRRTSKHLPHEFQSISTARIILAGSLWIIIRWMRARVIMKAEVSYFSVNTTKCYEISWNVTKSINMLRNVTKSVWPLLEPQKSRFLKQISFRNISASSRENSWVGNLENFLSIWCLCHEKTYSGPSVTSAHSILRNVTKCYEMLRNPDFVTFRDIS